MIDVVLCEELRSFVGKITTVRLNGLLAGCDLATTINYPYTCPQYVLITNTSLRCATARALRACEFILITFEM